jgi:hypothetical protein
MTLTRKERESLVIDLLNKCTPIREIATQAGLSFRGSGAIKKKQKRRRKQEKDNHDRCICQLMLTNSFPKVRLLKRWLLN